MPKDTKTWGTPLIPWPWPQNQTIAQRRADAPLRPTVAQEPPHTLGGLFGDSHLQTGLIDAIKKAK